MTRKLPFEEDASINKPPLFCGLNYKYWEARMKIFVESIDQGIWDATPWIVLPSLIVLPRIS